MHTARLRKRVGLGVILLAAAGAAAVARPGDRPADMPVPVSIPVASPFPAEPPPLSNPSVALDWSGPHTVRANKPNEFTLTVRNLSAQPAQKVVVQVRAPKDATVHHTAPAGRVVDGVYLWDLGNLDPKAATHLKLSLSTAARGQTGCQAWVTFTGTEGMTVAVREPKLHVTVAAPPTAVIGEAVKVTYTVKNVGDAPAEAVRHMLGRHFRCGITDCPKGTCPAPEYKTIAVLNPGEERSETVEVTADSGGELKLTAGARGPDVEAATADTTVKVLEPKLRASITGPDRVLIGRRAKYTITVENAGDTPVTLAKVARTLPAGWVTAPGSSWDGRTNPGTATTLDVGQKAEFPLELIPGFTGTGTVSVDVAGTRGAKATADKATLVDGVPALRMELVDLHDPVEKGEVTVYEIRVANTGTKSDTNVVVSCPLPPQLKLVSATGPVGSKTEDLGTCTVVKFEPVRELAPKTDAVYRVTVKAVTSGDVRFKAQLTSGQLSTSVVKEESTRVYGE
ncbi:MAG: hypothetical protein ACRC7O_04305 [Fimbriiglobus sp.]